MQILRWIIFLPLGVLAGALIQFLDPILMGFGVGTNTVITFSSSFLGGAAATYVSAWIAPTEKKLTIALLIAALSLVNLGVAIYYEDGILTSTFQLLGAILVAVLIHRKDIGFDFGSEHDDL